MTESGDYSVPFRSIIDRVTRLNLYEERRIDEKYGEFVFYARELTVWDAAISESLGPAVKPAGSAPSRDHTKLAQSFGGIRKDQTLFFKKFDDCSIMAMLWPWQDSEHITLKLIVL